MEFLIVDGTAVTRVSARTKSQAASVYAQRNLPKTAKAKGFRVRVFSMDEATNIECLATRRDDTVETFAQEVA